MRTKHYFMRFFASLLLAMMLLVSTVIKAVDVIAPNTDYYILNVGTDLFLGGQNNWGTNSCVSSDAGIFHFLKGTTTGEGWNIQNTLVSVTNKFLGTNLYVDNNGLATVKADESAGTTMQTDGIWSIEDLGGGVFAFKCMSEWSFDPETETWTEIPHGYLCRSEEHGLKKGYNMKFSETLTDDCKFFVMTYDEALAHMVNKAQSSNVSFNFLIKNPDFCNFQTTDAWEVSADCTNKNLAGGNNNNMCAESWHSTFTISQKIKDLPAGRYQLSAQGFYRQDGSDFDNMPFAYVGPWENPIAKAFIPLRTGTENSMIDASNSFSAGNYQIPPVQFDLAEKTDLEIGFQCQNETMWVIWDNLQLVREFVEATAISISQSEMLLGIGEKQTLQATVSPAYARQAVAWSSSDESVAVVEGNGLVTAVAEGTATITATTTDGTELSASSELNVIVKPSATSIALDQTELQVYLGETYQMQATILPEEAIQNFAWQSSKPEVATVDENGLITAVAEGTTTITATTVDGTELSATCEVTTAIPPVSSITLSKTVIGMLAGNTDQLTATVLPAEAIQAVTWHSSDESVATVDENGLVTAVAEGSATITATSTDGTELSEDCKVIVGIAAGQCGDNAYYILDKDYSLTIYGYGQMRNYSQGNAPWYGFREQIKNVTIEDGLTSIGNDAFANCPVFTSVTIPESVTSIGHRAFNEGMTHEIIFMGSTPPAVYSDAFRDDATFLVPAEAVDTYKAAWSSSADRIFALDVLSPETTVTEAAEGKSALLDAIGGVGSESGVVALKVRGTLNGYDIMLLRNKLTNLRYLDLSEAAIVEDANHYEYYTGCYTQNDVLGAHSFDGVSQLLRVTLPKDITLIGTSAFSGCSRLIEVKGMPNTCTTIEVSAFSGCGSLTDVEFSPNLEVIGTYAFYGCASLTEVVFPKNLESIESNAFYNCYGLRNLKLPASLKRIGRYAFAYCKLEEIHIPSMIESIGDNAFTGTGIKDVYAYSLVPISIGQNTFPYDGVTLHAPQTPESVFNDYYYNTQWSQFTNVVEFNAEYSSWYAPEDYDIVVESGEEIPSEDKETGANGEMQPGSGLIYEEGASQKLDWLSMIWQDGKNFPSLLYNENVNINNLSITLKIEKNKWYFFCFPFNVDLTNASYPGKHYVWRYYDGDERALHGVGGWKNNVGNTLTAGQGYIFQTNKSGDVVLTIANPEFGNGDTEVALTAHASGELQDANWNFVGNKNLSYYDINALVDKFQSPITVWDAANSTYNAIVPGDDDYSFHPYEAFFVQKPSGKSKISFGSEGRETYSQKQSMAAARAVVRAARVADASRQIVNLTLSDGNKTDKTRVVFNDERSESYEQECDASKFLSSGVPQIYTMDAKRVKYAINERAKGTGIVNIGYVATEAGSYVISAPRMDCPMILKDNVTGAVCRLSEGAYTFNTEAGTNESRFTLMPDNTTSVKDMKMLGGLSLRAVNGGIAVKGLNGKSVAIYSIGGAMITSATSDGTISLPAGVYVVSYDGNNVKMSVQ